jgi:LysR family glycine cleavage system transcriptional activator
MPLRSLSGLLDFECAARWTSFQRAALELHKTPAAVSQQVKQLEHALGFALFARYPRHIALTDKGRELAASLSRLLGELQAKVGALQDGDAERVLRISTTHSFAIKWLVPRLHRFTAAHPQLDLRVEASDQVAALDSDACDVALRYGQLASGDADIVYRERLVVVSSPALDAAPRTLSQLLSHPLIYEGTPELWLRVLEANRVAARRARFARSYSHGGLLVQAAVAGLGVALAPYALAHEDIEQGRLRLCPCTPLASAYCYRLLCSPDRRGLAKVQAFAAWVRGELAAM